MKTLRLLIFGVVALAQLTVPAAMVWQRNQTLEQGRVWKFRTAPVDPVDVIRGRYIALRF
ncbi:MAG: GDYXXLXY domain-containing protein, partial [Candidatus Udaeobacter sp.]